MCAYALKDVRETGAACPVLAWMPSPMSSVLRMSGPENLGGLGDLQAKIAAEAAATGKPVTEIAMSVSDRVSARYFIKKLRGITRVGLTQVHW
jgi:hypothetical protein